MALASPIAIRIVDITLKKLTGEEMSLMPQFLEFVIYQSVFQPMIRAELVLVDPIGLFYNFPLVGEESVIVKYEPTRLPAESGDDARTAQVLQWEFMVNSARSIDPDDKAKQQSYSIELYSREMEVNAKQRVQRAFKEEYHTAAKKVLVENLGVAPVKIKDVLFEPAKGIFHYIVPNLKPLETVAWMAKRAVAANPSHHFYMFYENFDGYNFRTYEDIFEKGSTGTIREYYYISNQDKIALDRLSSPSGDTIKKHQVISAMQTHKRFNTIEKAVFGYYENEYYDIDVFNKTISSTRHRLKPNDADLKKYNLNKDEFTTRMQTQGDKPGVSPRTHYVISQDKGDTPNSRTFWEDKFGPVTKTHAALMQISMTVAVPGDTNVQAGSVIKLELPEIYGFTTVKKDRYLVGTYIVTAVKHVISVGERHVMSLELHRPNFEEAIAIKSDFKFGDN